MEKSGTVYFPPNLRTWLAPVSGSSIFAYNMKLWVRYYICIYVCQYIQCS